MRDQRAGAVGAFALTLLVLLASLVQAAPDPGSAVDPVAQGVTEAGDRLGADALPDDVPLGAQGPGALDKVGSALGAAGAWVADMAGTVVAAIGDTIAAVGGAIAAVAKGLWIAVVWLATGTWTLIVATGRGIAAGTTWMWSGVAALGGLIGALFGGAIGLWPDAPAHQAVVASSAGTAAAAGAAWYSRAWRYLGYVPFLAPLYARIERKDLLDHPVRAKLYARVSATPGIHVSELARAQDLPWGTMLHHLDKLEKGRLVVSVAASGKRCLFLQGQVPLGQRTMMPALENAKARSLAAFFAENAGASQSDAASALDISPALVSWHVKRLEKAGVLTRRREGRSQRIGVTGEAMPLVAA